MSLVLLFLNITLLAWLTWYYFKRQKSEDARIFFFAIAARLACGIGLGMLYFYHYGVGDTLSFWQDGNHLASIMVESPGRALAFFWNEDSTPEIISALQQQTPRSIFFVKICGILSLLSGGNYWVMATWLSFASFVGSWVLYTRFVQFYPATKAATATALLFIPSVVFWSSGLIKESIGLSALFLLTAGCLSVVNDKRISAVDWVILLVSLWVGWNLKYYWIGMFLPVAVPLMLTAILIRKYAGLTPYRVWVWGAMFVVFLALATNVHPNFYVSRFMEVIYQNNLEFTRMSEPPRIVQYLNLEPSTASVVMNAPAALIAGLFRPFVWEAFNTLSWLAALENTVILLLVLQAILSLKIAYRSPHSVLVFATIVYIVLLTTFLALSTPNFGTLSRYRVGALPLLVLLCLLPSTPVGKWLSGRRWFR